MQVDATLRGGTVVGRSEKAEGHRDQLSNWGNMQGRGDPQALEMDDVSLRRAPPSPMTSNERETSSRPVPDLAEAAVLRPPTPIISRFFKTPSSLVSESSSSHRSSPHPGPTASPSPTRGRTGSSARSSSPIFQTSLFLDPGKRVYVFHRVSQLFTGRCRLVPWLVLLVLVWTFIGVQVQKKWSDVEPQHLDKERSSKYIHLSRFPSIRRDSSGGTALNYNKSESYKNGSPERGWLSKDSTRGASSDKDEGKSAIRSNSYGGKALESKSESYKDGSPGRGWLWEDHFTRGASNDRQEGNRGRKDAGISVEVEGLAHTLASEGENVEFRKAEENQPLESKSSACMSNHGAAAESRQVLRDVFEDESPPHISKLSESSGSSSKAIGQLVGPFDQLEVRIVGREGSKEKCEISLFSKFVANRVIVVVFHELSMTGAPLSVLELATKMRICGGRVSAVVLNKAGGLYPALAERGIDIVQDKSVHSWNAAAKADLVFVGSAACAPWVGKYLSFNEKGADRLVWWVMENRREYFDRAKHLLGKVRALIFLSQAQAQLWTDWYSRDGLSFTPDVDIVPLSVNNELFLVAGRTEEVDNDDITGKCSKLRGEVRREMGVEPDDLLLMILSSINSGKGQLLLVQAALMVARGIEDEGLEGFVEMEADLERVEGRSRRSLSSGQHVLHTTRTGGGDSSRFGRAKKEFLRTEQEVDDDYDLERILKMRLLIGSVGSKSNKPAYVEKIVKILDQQPHLAKSVLSVPATRHVAPLYAAADAYVMNAQGIGETFGRVTIEAMAFGLPVLATNAGGSREIVEANVTGLLHPTGRAGIPVLAQHIRWLLEHKEERRQMGQKGREKVNLLFREDIMYEKLARILMRVVGAV